MIRDQRWGCKKEKKKNDEETRCTNNENPDWMNEDGKMKSQRHGIKREGK